MNFESYWLRSEENPDLFGFFLLLSQGGAQFQMMCSFIPSMVASQG